MSEINLPEWAKLVDSRPGIAVTIEVDSAAAYAAWLSELNVDNTIDQYWLEVAYQCIKLDVQAALEASELSPLKLGAPAQINFTRAEQFAQKNYPVGRGAHAATKGREAREHYKRRRGRVPFST